MSFKQQLIKLNACKEAIDWVEDRTLDQAWNDCHRSDWMAWFIAEGLLNEQLTVLEINKLLGLIGCWCARRMVRHLEEDERERSALCYKTIAAKHFLIKCGELGSFIKDGTDLRQALLKEITFAKVLNVTSLSAAAWIILNVTKPKIDIYENIETETISILSVAAEWYNEAWCDEAHDQISYIRDLLLFKDQYLRRFK